jgi:antitoxin VapB
VRTPKAGPTGKATGRAAADAPAHAPADLPQRIRAHLFLVSRSQAVRLPKAFRFSGTEVFIYRRGESVVLEPVTQSQWPARYWESVDAKQEDLSLGRDPDAAPTDASVGSPSPRRHRVPREQPKPQ